MKEFLLKIRKWNTLKVQQQFREYQMKNSYIFIDKALSWYAH